MKIIGCFTSGPAPDKVSGEEWQEAASTGKADLRYLKSRLEPQDESSLELALRFAEEAKACALGAVTAGDARATQFLETLAALGFARLARIDHENAFAPFATAEMLAQYLVKENPDVILCGSQSSLGSSKTVPLLLGERLGIPCISGVTGFEPATTGGLRVTYRQDGQTICESVPTPILLAIGDVPRTFLRVPTLMQRMTSGTVPIEVIVPEGIRSEPAELVGFTYPNQTRPAELVDGADPKEAAAAIYEVLREEGVVAS